MIMFDAHNLNITIIHLIINNLSIYFTKNHKQEINKIKSYLVLIFEFSMKFTIQIIKIL